MSDLRLGVAWEDRVQGDSGRKWFRLSLALGMLPPLKCRIVENPAHKGNEHAPTHNIMFSPLDGEDVKVGSLWTNVSEATGAEYLSGVLDLAAFGVVDLKGGAKLDLRRALEKRIRLSAARDRKSEKSPTHCLWLQTPKPKTSRPIEAEERPADEPEPAMAATGDEAEAEDADEPATF